jgi:uncharacterized protein (DUF2249 family)
LQAYPDLENKLIDLVPAFRKLKNPILKKTVTRITSLQQAAVIGNIPVDKLVNSMRQETGQQLLTISDNTNYKIYTEEDEKFVSIIGTYDIRPILNAGRQPINEVLKLVQKLQKDETLKLIAPFIPAPLIDQLTGKHFTCKIKKVNNDHYEVYITRKDHN